MFVGNKKRGKCIAGKLNLDRGKKRKRNLKKRGRDLKVPSGKRGKTKVN